MIEQLEVTRRCKCKLATPAGQDLIHLANTTQEFLKIRVSCNFTLSLAECIFESRCSQT